MGQRLVVTIKNKGEDKMKIYYHWSGYTMSTFEELQKLWDIIKPLKKAGKSTEEILLGIIHGLEGNVDKDFRAWLEMNSVENKKIYGGKLPSCHGGVGWFNKESKLGSDDNLPNTELEYIQSLYPGETFSTDVDRNNGLVYMSKDGMADAQAWSEGDAWIDLDTETFSHEINWPYHGKDDYIERLSYDRCGDESDEETVDELAKEYDSMPTYKGDGQNLFEGKCDDLRADANALFDVVGNNNFAFKDSKGTVWELLG